jgi:DNA-binding response OmpR family regulator
MLGLEAMKGFEDWRKEDRQTNNINDDMLIIGMSTSASEREQADGFTYGMHVYASKPFDLELLEIILEKRRNHKTIEDCTREICGMATVAPKQSTQEQCDDSKIAETGRKSSRRDLLRFFRFRSNKVIPIG